jgi:hypothetical protein
LVFIAVEVVARPLGATAHTLPAVEGSTSVAEVLRQLETTDPQVTSTPDAADSSWGKLHVLGRLDFNTPATEGDVQAEDAAGEGATIDLVTHMLDQGNWSLRRSLWDSLPSNSADDVAESSSGTALTLQRFNNMCADVAQGLHSYANYGTRLPVAREGTVTIASWLVLCSHCSC